MSDKYIKEITQNIPNNELNAAYDALMNSSLNETSDYEEVSMEELNEYIEGLECQAEELRTQLAKANEEYKNLFEIFESCQARMLRYKSAIDEECVLWDFTVDEKEPRKSIQRLLDITDAVARDPDVNSKARKFAIENQIKGAKALIYAFPLNACDQMKEWVEQLRKEQTND